MHGPVAAIYVFRFASRRDRVTDDVFQETCRIASRLRLTNSVN